MQHGDAFDAGREALLPAASRPQPASFFGAVTQLALSEDSNSGKDEPGLHSCRRLFEWTMGAIMLGIGFWMLAFPGSLGATRFSSVLMMINGPDLAALCVVIGTARCVALFLNGRLVNWGPRLRAALSMLTAAVLVELAIALISPIDPPIGVVVFFILAASEVITVWRARRDLSGLSDPT